MNTGQIILTVAATITNILIAIIGFFLRRTISQNDNNAKGIDVLDKLKASRPELEKAQQTLQDQLNKQAKDIEGIKADYITKEDFFREQAKTDRQLGRIMDILLEIKSGVQSNGNGH